ncbi:MAG: hypothetical protein IJN20_01050 [Oscillospiraceae bacterium]|nr:hypothetical protein [Oscillospiraceae bacterium]
MNQKKTNHVLQHSLGLTILLCIAALVVSTGTAFARYYTERTANITFEVQPWQTASIGTWEEVSQEEATAQQRAGTKVFRPAQYLQWETTDTDARLNLTVANGVSETEFANDDLKVTLRLLGTSGLWTGEDTVKLNLHFPSQTKSGETESMQAAVAPIEEGTPLYQTHGPGWIYSFQIPDGELSWTLTGGQFSSVDLMITVEGAILKDPAALQPWVVTEIIGK